MSAAVPLPVTGNSDYRAFDRSTRAGRLLHNLYTQKSKDSTLDKDLLKRLEANRKFREANATPKVKPVPKSQAYVELPSPPKKEYPKMLPPVGRKPLKAIEENEKVMTAEQRRREEERRAAQKPALTDEDKFKLQHKFQFGFEPTSNVMRAYHLEHKDYASAQKYPVVSQQQLSAVQQPKPSARALERRMWQKRFDELSDEISERKQFLAEMGPAQTQNNFNSNNTKAVIAVKERKTRVMSEMNEKLRELKEVDARLKQLDDDDTESNA